MHQFSIYFMEENYNIFIQVLHVFDTLGSRHGRIKNECSNPCTGFSILNVTEIPIIFYTLGDPGVQCISSFWYTTFAGVAWIHMVTSNLQKNHIISYCKDMCFTVLGDPALVCQKLSVQIKNRDVCLHLGLQTPALPRETFSPSNTGAATKLVGRWTLDIKIKIMAGSQHLQTWARYLMSIYTHD